MGRNVKHYTKRGRLHTGGTHKMPNGDIHSGKKHTKNIQKHAKTKIPKSSHSKNSRVIFF